MGEQVRPSIYVAPLHIVKSTFNGACYTAMPRPTSPTICHEHQIPYQEHQLPFHQQLTPPLTPQTSNEAVGGLAMHANKTFQTFLRAYYPFQPTAALSPLTVTLPLNAGDIVLVHSIHTNGWADGTLLQTGARGWLPTNYCEAYEYKPMRPLLKALTEFWDKIRSGSFMTLDIFCNQDYMRGLIAGIRWLLDWSHCLTRDSPLVKHHENVRRARKALLSDLSYLVSISKRMQNISLGSHPDESAGVIEDILDNMLLKAFSVVIRGVQFLDTWSDEVGPRESMVRASPTCQKSMVVGQNVTLTPPADLIHPNPLHVVDPIAVAEASGVPTTLDSSKQRVTPRPPSIATHDFRQCSKGSNASSIDSRPLSPHSNRASVYIDASCGGKVEVNGTLSLASEKLGSSYDNFLSVLGAFLGLHMQSRSSSELLLTTQRSVNSCRELLAVIETVLDHDHHQSTTLLEAKDAMYDRITDLVHAARVIFAQVGSEDEEVAFMPDQGRRLVKAATDCVRGAGDCVAETRMVLERTGDFELKQPTIRSCISTVGSAKSSRTPSDRGHSLADSTEDIRDQKTARVSSNPSFLADQPQKPEAMNMPPTPIAAEVRTSLTNPISLESMVDSTEFLNEINKKSPVTTKTAPRTLAVQNDQSLAYTAEMQFKHPNSIARSVITSLDSNSTYVSSAGDSEDSAVSKMQITATSPDRQLDGFNADGVGSRFSGSEVTLADDCDEIDVKALERRLGHELMYNKDGHIIGGTMAALIESLTAHHSTPDALFVSTFYLTFRLFASATEFAEALVYRFDHIGTAPRIAGPVRLRVYNIFKGWLESHWRHDCDNSALPVVLDFAKQKLTPVLPTAGRRLIEVAEKVAATYGPLVPRLVSSIGKTNTSIAQYVSPHAPVPAPVITKTQLAGLRTWKMGGPNVHILDFDPLELARQITIKESSIFCSILPEELLASEWMKNSGSLAVNVRAMSTLSTDLANLVADSILQLEEPKRRAIVIKQWIKIANKCLELKNYDSLMAIICSLNSCTIVRLRKTWENLSQKTKATLEDLKRIVDVSRNHMVLRQRLQNHVPPCLPFVGTYLTDLTFVDHGNPGARQLTTDRGSMEVINYDKHMKTARIISELQRFQIPYRLREVPELQTWIQDQLVRIRSSGEKSFQTYYRRSLVLEPREASQAKPLVTGHLAQYVRSGDKFDFRAWVHTTKDKSVATQG